MNNITGYIVPTGCASSLVTCPPPMSRRSKAKKLQPDPSPSTPSSPAHPGFAESPRWRWFLLFALATIIAYASTIRAPFEYDDQPAIQQNLSIRHLSDPVALLNPPPQTPVSGRPAVNVSFALNYAINEWLGVEQSADLSGPNATVTFHLVNIALHFMCGALLFAILCRTLAARIPDEKRSSVVALSGVTTLLWLVHPIQSEAVTYLTQRTELLVSTFLAATLYASIRAWDATRESSRRWWYAFGIVASALGMASKEVMLAAPLVVILYDRAFRSRSWGEVFSRRDRVLFYAGLLATASIVVLSILAGQRSQSVGFDRGVTWYQYLYTQGWAIAHYLRLIIWPNALTFDYGEVVSIGWRGVPGLILVSALGAATLWAWTTNRMPGLAFLGIWFFLLLAPSSSVVPIKTEMAAERRIYLASAAVFLLIVLAGRALFDRMRVAGAGRRLVIAAAGLVLTVATFCRGLTYSSPERLFRDTVEKAPQNPRAHVSLGLALLRQGPARFDEAAASFHRAIDADSTYVVAWRSLGVAETMRGDWREAERAFRIVLQRWPDNVDATDGIGRALLHLNEPDSARPFVDRMGTRDLELLWMLGDLLVQGGRGREAVPYLEAASRTQRPPALGLALLSMAYAQASRPTEATQAASAAVGVAGDTATVFALAGRAMLAIDRIADARAYLQHALTLDPTLQAARDGLEAIRRR